jgi:hypothetical protein
VSFLRSASIAFVTVSYAPDRDRCALLSRSVAALAPSVQHYIVVDNADRRHFASLESSRTTMLTTEEVLPARVHRVKTRALGLRSNLWVQAGGKPIRGWLVQQLVKFALAEKLDADVLVHADSDVVLVRPFEPSSIVDTEGRVRLCVEPGAIDAGLPNHVRWHRNAERLISIEGTEPPFPDYITSFVPWRRDNAVALLEHIERMTGRSWLRAIASAWDVSEYTLYGRFVTDVLSGRGQFTAPSLCRDYWAHATLSAPELDAFLKSVAPDQLAVQITAKAGMNPADYAAAIERRWAAPLLS